jgi:hypothetical protein
VGKSGLTVWRQLFFPENSLNVAWTHSLISCADLVQEAEHRVQSSFVQDANSRVGCLVVLLLSSGVRGYHDGGRVIRAYASRNSKVVPSFSTSGTAHVIQPAPSSVVRSTNCSVTIRLEAQDERDDARDE